MTPVTRKFVAGSLGASMAGMQAAETGSSLPDSDLGWAMFGLRAFIALAGMIWGWSSGATPPPPPEDPRWPMGMQR